MPIVVENTIIHKGDPSKNQYCKLEGRISSNGNICWYNLWSFCPYCGERLPKATHEVGSTSSVL